MQSHIISQAYFTFIGESEVIEQPVIKTFDSYTLVRDEEAERYLSHPCRAVDSLSSIPNHQCYSMVHFLPFV